MKALAVPPLLVSAMVAVAVDAPPLFPPVSELEPALKMPEAARFEIGKDGNFLVDGKPRFLLGTLYYLGTGGESLAPGPGYGPDDAWIYESPPTRDYLQRLGFDAVGGEVSASWMRHYRPEKSFWRADRVIDWTFASNFWHSGLPAILDLTAARWSHGGIRFEEGRTPVARAFVDDPERACHFISYSLVTDEGRDVWRRFWRTGAEEVKANGARPFAYELFNEPRYDDRSSGAREAFATFLSERFGGDPAAMDAAWGSAYGSFAAAAAFERPNEFVGLGVEWLKFREAAFERGVLLGRETIRSVDPDARVCYQPLAHFVDVDRVIGSERHCQVVMTPTGGDDLWNNLRLLALADGKPLVDGETYFRNTRASHHGRVVRHFARGINASYYFKWERRLDELNPRNEEGLERLFERFPWLGLNPRGTPPEALAGLMDGKRDVFAVQDLFGPRDRGIPSDRRIAVLSSLPTARLAEAAGFRSHAFEREAALALAVGAHVPVDAIHEEQLPEGRLDRYKVLVAAGVAATCPATRDILKKWVERGGMLILVGEALELDEYARRSPADFPGITLGDEVGGEPQTFRFAPSRPSPRPARTYEAAPYREVSFEEGWKTLAKFPDGRPAVAERRFGHGLVMYVGARFPDATSEGLLLSSMADNGVFPTCETLDPATGESIPDIEVHAARGERGAVGFIVENLGLAPRVVRFVPRGFFQAPVLADVSRRVLLGRDEDGAALLLLEPNVPMVLRGAPTQSALEAAFATAPRAWNEGATAWGAIENEPAAVAGSESGDGRAPLGQSGVTDHPALREEPYDDVAAHSSAWLAAHTTAARARAKAFAVDPARVRFLDLRDAATVPYHDAVADDGKGGWTDQGANCMENAPWGVTDCNGVPFDFIRPDQNGDRAAVVLRSTRQPWLPEAVRGIRADLRAEALYFLHAGAFLEPRAEAFRYVVRYADGTSLALPMRGYVEFDDWWMHGPVPGGRDAMPCKPGWLNAKSRGFHVWRWENPFPEKTIATIDIESADTKTAPIVAAITAELAPAGLRVEPVTGVPRIQAWKGFRAAFGESDGSDWKTPAQAEDWAGATFSWPEPVSVPAAARADLEFDLVPADGLSLPPLQMKVGEKTAYLPLDSFMRPSGRPGAWRVSFPLDLAADGPGAPFREFSLQLRGALPAGAAPALRVLAPRFVLRDVPENPLALRRLLAKGYHGVTTIYRDGGLELAVDDKTEGWGIARFSPVRAVPLPADPATAVLAFDVNGGRTPLGRRDRGRQRFRVGFVCAHADGSTAEGPWVRDPPTEDGPVDDDPNSWQTVRIPLPELLPEGAVSVTGLSVQFTGLPAGADRAGLLVRNFRFEPASP